MVSSTPLPHFTPGKDPVPILQEAKWAPGPVWWGGKSRPHQDSIPDHPACSQSLYRLSYPAHVYTHTHTHTHTRGPGSTGWELIYIYIYTYIYKLLPTEPYKIPKECIIVFRCVNGSPEQGRRSNIRLKKVRERRI